MYRITRYTLEKAKAIGVIVKPSKTNGKKIDVFRNGIKIASVGAIGYNDFPTYMAKYGRELAMQRRRAYKIRHENDRHKKWSPGWLADQLLW